MIAVDVYNVYLQYNLRVFEQGFARRSLVDWLSEERQLKQF